MAIKLMHLITVILLIALIAFLYSTLRRDTLRDEKFIEDFHKFQTLSDGKSAQGTTTVIERPTFVDNLFGTEKSKFYKELLKEIPEVVRQELAKQNFSKSVTEVNRTMFYLQGDSAVFLNSDGIATKVMKVYPYNKDSSVLILLPQKLEVTNVRVEPDKNDPDNVVMYWSAINRTTGDTLKIDEAISTRIGSPSWKFKIRPFFGAGTTYTNKGYFGEIGFLPLTYRSPKYEIELLRTNVRYLYGSSPTVESKISLLFR